MNKSGDTHYSRQHAVVTGGAGGIGAAIAGALAGAGARVTLLGRNRENLQATASRLGALWQVADVTRPDEVHAGFEAAAAAGGPVTILVNNAGAAESSVFSKMSDELWDRMLAVNLTGTFLCTKAVVEAMREAGFGRVVNIASTAALRGYPYVSAYCAAKHGVVGLTRALALELAQTGVTVNAVCPGYTDTPMVTRAVDTIVGHTGRDREQALGELVRLNPQGRLVRPAEVAATVLWLCGPDSAAITGQAVAVAGGEVA